MTSALTLEFSQDTYILTVVMTPTPVVVEVSTARPGDEGPMGPPGVGKTWVAITQADYNALSPEDRNDPAKIYDIIDFTWT